jgi:DNA-binding SARP family transcriptional activator
LTGVGGAISGSEPPLGSYFQSQRARLEELRASATEEWLAAEIELDNHADALAELVVAVTEQPYRERRWELLMWALYRCGRTVDALSAYADVRRLLGQELGLDPGPGLRELHQRILTGDLSPTTRQTVPFSPAPVQLARAGVQPTRPASLHSGGGDWSSAQRMLRTSPTTHRWSGHREVS